jgi:hypothetical protein
MPGGRRQPAWERLSTVSNHVLLPQHKCLHHSSNLKPPNSMPTAAGGSGGRQPSGNQGSNKDTGHQVTKVKILRSGTGNFRQLPMWTLDLQRNPQELPGYVVRTPAVQLLSGSVRPPGRPVAGLKSAPRSTTVSPLRSSTRARSLRDP